jgi:hypothetical protein
VGTPSRSPRDGFAIVRPSQNYSSYIHVYYLIWPNKKYILIKFDGDMHGFAGANNQVWMLPVMPAL